MVPEFGQLLLENPVQIQVYAFLKAADVDQEWPTPGRKKK